jgi:hypothetical protein
MATLTIPYNHDRDPMNPGDLADKIATALAISSAPLIDINPSAIVITHPSISSASQAVIQTVIDAYVFDPDWTGPTGTPSGNVGLLAKKATVALAANIAALALPAPSYPLSNAAQQALVNQVQALTRQVNALIRLAQGLLDSTDGT